MSSSDKTTATFANYERSNRFQESMENFASALFASFKGKIDLSNDKHKELLAKWESRINGTVILDRSICDGLIYDLSSLISDEKAASNFRETAFAAVSQVDEAIKLDTVKEEDMWKYKALQVLAIATPLGLFSAFNYLDFMANIFGPMFGNAGLATGIAEAGTHIPILGKVFEFFRGDDAIKLVLDLPILKDVLEVGTDILQIDAVQAVGGEVAPVAINSEILMSMAAAGLIISRLPEDIDRQKERKNVEKVQEGSLAKLNGAIKKVEEIIDKSKEYNDVRKKVEEQKNNNVTSVNAGQDPSTSVDAKAASHTTTGYHIPIQNKPQSHVEKQRLLPNPTSNPLHSL